MGDHPGAADNAQDEEEPFFVILNTDESLDRHSSIRKGLKVKLRVRYQLGFVDVVPQILLNTF